MCSRIQSSIISTIFLSLSDFVYWFMSIILCNFVIFGKKSSFTLQIQVRSFSNVISTIQINLYVHNTLNLFYLQTIWIYLFLCIVWITLKFQQMILSIPMYAKKIFVNFNRWTQVFTERLSTFSRNVLSISRRRKRRVEG